MSKIIEVDALRKYYKLIVMSKKIKQNCIYCSSNKDMTVDHIPPKAIFPKPRPSNMLTVPSCKTCNKSFEKDDEYFRNILAIAASTHTHDPNVEAVSDKLIRSIRRNEATRMANSFMANFYKANLISPGGIYLGRSPAIQVDAKRMKRVADRIVYGLFYKIHGYPVPNEYEIIFKIEDYQLSVPREIINRYKNFWIEPITIGNNIFSYTYFKCTDDPNIMSIIYWFYDKLWFVGFVILNASRMR